MLNTPLVGLLGVEHPIIQAGMGTFGGAALAAAVSNAGAIGTIGAAKRSAENLRSELEALGGLTDRSAIVNFTRPWLHLYPECLEVALAERPRAISISAGLPAELVPHIHERGIVVIAQVQSVEQARKAADQGVDIVIAQGAEAGGFGARMGVLALLPQVVDAVAPLPVVAAGGISDGRGLAAVLLLGAAGANIGTRFLATREASLGSEWKRRIVSAGSDERLALPPSPSTGADDGREAPAVPLVAMHDAAMGSDRPSTGQGAGAIGSIEAAADVVAQLVREAEESLVRVPRALGVGAAAGPAGVAS